MKGRAAENGSGWQKIERDGDKPSRGLKKIRDVASTPQAIKSKKNSIACVLMHYLVRQ